MRDAKSPVEEESIGRSKSRPFQKAQKSRRVVVVPQRNSSTWEEEEEVGWVEVLGREEVERDGEQAF